MGPRPEHLPDPLAGENRRKQFRHEVRWWAQLEVGTDCLACYVFDLSPSGAKVRVAKPMTAHQPVRLRMTPFGGFEGEVVWSRDGIAGIRFADAEHDRITKLIASGLNELPM
jgi:PilZ domain-containing protein